METCAACLCGRSRAATDGLEARGPQVKNGNAEAELAGAPTAPVVEERARVPALLTAHLYSDVGAVMASLIALTAFLVNRYGVFGASGKPVGIEAAWFVFVNVLAVLQMLVVSLLLADIFLPGLGVELFRKEIAHAVGIAVPVVRATSGIDIGRSGRGRRDSTRHPRRLVEGTYATWNLVQELAVNPPLGPGQPPGLLENYGFCPCCDQVTRFVAKGPWLRDQYICVSCESIPRERALMWCIERFYPNWRDALIHESSPVMRGASIKLQREAARYTGSQYYPSIPLGSMHEGYRCEDLEKLTFADESIELHVTQDVMEHVFDPEAAFREFARTLRPGGMHIFTTPLVNKEAATEVCARLRPNGSVEHLREPEYHGSPVSAEGALVTRRWGYDICQIIFRASGLFTEMVYLDAVELGIRAEYIEVLLTRKPKR